jgi:hypothetical protein
VDIVQQLRDAEVPVLLAMRVQQENGNAANVTTTELLKYLARQAIQIQHKQQTERSMSLKCAAYQEASTDSEWFQLLEAVLSSISDQLYIIVDLEILDKTAESVDGFSWIQAFERLFKTIDARGLSAKIKVLFVSYGTLPLQLSATDRSRFVISAKAQFVTARQRRAGRGISSQQIPLRLRNLPSVAARGGRGRGRG